MKSEPAWLCPEELKFKAERYFLCVYTERTTKQNLQLEIFMHCICFQANLCLWFGSPFSFDSEPKLLLLVHTNSWANPSLVSYLPTLRRGVEHVQTSNVGVIFSPLPDHKQPVQEERFHHMRLGWFSRKWCTTPILTFAWRQPWGETFSMSIQSIRSFTRAPSLTAGHSVKETKGCPRCQRSYYLV